MKLRYLRYAISKFLFSRISIFVCIVLALTTSQVSSFSTRSAAALEDPLLLSQPLMIAWRYQTDQTTDLTPAADSQTVFVPLSSGILMALNAADGKLKWRAEAGGAFSATPVADDRSVFAAQRTGEPTRQTNGGTLRALSKTTGVTLWTRVMPVAISAGLAVDSAALFAATGDGRVFAFDKRTGVTLWSNQYQETFIAQPTVAGGRVYFGSKAGIVRALNAKTGELVWQYKTNGSIQGPVAVNEDVAYFGSDDGNVYAFNEAHARLAWHRRTGAGVQAVTVVSNGVLAASLDNFAYLLSLNRGALIWRRQLPGRISSRPVTASDGALFTPFSTDQAIVLNLRDGKTANALALGEENSSAAAPVAINNLVLITIPHGLLAFASANQK